MISQFILIEKYKITHDVYHLVFTRNGDGIMPQYGQFLTFFLKIGARAYSIANSDGNRYEFIIKRLEDGKGGSKEICDLDIKAEVKGVGPVGKFTLKETPYNKLFLGTGTGFAPLYFQILGSYKLGLSGKKKFIFGIREKKDIFYINELNAIKQKGDFDYEIYISREEEKEYKFGRITSYITKENISDFQEFYICGSPSMVHEAKEKLSELGIEKDFIFSEEY